MKLIASGRDLFGGNGQVAFILAILVVDDDQHFAIAKIFNGFLDGSKVHIGISARARTVVAVPAHSLSYLCVGGDAGLEMPRLGGLDGSIDGVDVLYALIRHPILQRLRSLLAIYLNAVFPGRAAAQHA